MSMARRGEVTRAVAARADAHALLAGVAAPLAEAAELLARCLGGGRRVYACGNGGSAAQAAHFAAELVGRFKRDRGALPVVALTDNVAALSAVANDYAFEEVFARAVRGMAGAGDALVALSTSGTSPNVVRACEAARECGAHVVGLTGRGGGELARRCDVLVAVDSDATDRIQETHLMALHILCEAIEAACFGA